MAKKKSTPKPSTTIPESLKKHIHAQHETLYVVQSLLICIGEAIKGSREEPANSAAYSLIHIDGLLRDMSHGLDDVTLRQVVEGQS